MKNVLAIFLSLMFISSSLNGAGVEFWEFERGVYEKARIKAAEEGKLLFIDFYAKWCTPCKWMDETTFIDPKVVNLLDEKYVSVKVDIDEMEGFELKSRFDIKYLPTMLIFNSEGKMIERIEETLSPSKMEAVLGSHSPSAPVTSVKHDFNMSPHDVSGKLLNPLDKEDDSMVLSQREYRSYFSQKETSYKMQMGVFKNFDGAMEKVSNLRKIFIEEIVIVEDSRGDEVLYKVIMGEFDSMSAAESFRVLLKDKYHLDSILY